MVQAQGLPGAAFRVSFSVQGEAMAVHALGVNPKQTAAAAASLAIGGAALGNYAFDGAGGVYVLAVGNATTTISANNAAGLDTTSFTIEPLTAALVTTRRLAVPVVDIPAGLYGWVLVRGACVVEVEANSAAGVPLYTTATPGRLTSATGGTLVPTVMLITARGAGSGPASARIDAHHLLRQTDSYRNALPGA